MYTKDNRMRCFSLHNVQKLFYSQMGSKKMMMLFLIFFTSLYFSASSSPDNKVFVSDSLQEHNFGFTGRHKYKINSVDSDGANNGRNGIVHSRKFSHGGTQGGGSTGAGTNGNGNYNSPSATAVIPVIVAGAANNNHHQNPHRGAANCNRNCIRSSTMIMSTLATLAVHIYV